MKNVFRCLLLFAFLFNFNVNYANDKARKSRNDSVTAAFLFNESDFLLHPVNIDSLPKAFQSSIPIRQHQSVFLTTGNLGAPALNIASFSKHNNVNDFIFLNPYQSYLFCPDNRLYYNTRKPYSNLTYSSTLGSKVTIGQTLRIIHTQNVNKNLNLGLSYDMISSEGFYAYQKAKHGKFSFFSNYDGLRYFALGNININSIKNKENGGVDSLAYYGFLRKTQIYTVNRKDALSKLNQKSVYLFHKYRLGKKVLVNDTAVNDSSLKDKYRVDEKASFFHTFNYSFSNRKFTDLGFNEKYYYTTVIDSNATFDSVYFRNFRNAVGFELIEKGKSFLTPGFRFSALMEQKRYGYYDHILGSVFDTSAYTDAFLHNEFINASVFHRYNSLVRWHATLNYCFSGYDKNDYLGDLSFKIRLGRNIDSSFIHASMYFDKSTPDYFYQNFNSNHAQWHNEFLPELTSELNVYYFNMKYSLNIGALYNQSRNTVFWDYSTLPSQSENGYDLIKFWLKKEFSLWKLKSIFSLTYNVLSNDDVIHLPNYTFVNTSYFDFPILFKGTGGRIDMQIGFETWYYSLFKAYEYMPSIGQFSLSNRKLGDYPYFDAFIALKIKRACFFIRAEHLNSGNMGKSYMTVWPYPMNERLFRLGLSWNFYN